MTDQFTDTSPGPGSRTSAKSRLVRSSASRYQLTAACYVVGADLPGYRACPTRSTSLMGPFCFSVSASHVRASYSTRLVEAVAI